MAFDDALVPPRQDVPLAPLTTLRVGGFAQWYVRVATAAHLQSAHAWALDRGLPVFVLGGGSNVVIADSGIPGLVLHVVIDGIAFHEHGDEAIVEAGAGEVWDHVVARVVDRGYAGIETLSGIPGFVGGTPIQNVGAYGQEVADTIDTVTALDTHSGELVDIPARGCGFAYRQSRFKQVDIGRFIVCAVRFRIRRGAATVTYPDVKAWAVHSALERPTVADIRRGVIEIRRRKGMVLDPDDADTQSVGSFFVNPIVAASTAAALGSPSFPAPDGRVKIPAAWLIERVGFGKGFGAGAAGVSSKHPLAIVNRGGATSSDIVDLACRIKHTVLDRYGIALRPEPIFAGFGEDERINFLKRDSR